MQFVYEFERYRYWIRDDWELMFAHEADGTVTDGSWRELHDAHQAGKDIKVGLVNLCADLAGESREHVVFSPAGSSWTHTPTELIETQSHPLVRVAPGKPLGYAGSRVGWTRYNPHFLLLSFHGLSNHGSRGWGRIEPSSL